MCGFPRDPSASLEVESTFNANKTLDGSSTFASLAFSRTPTQMLGQSGKSQVSSSEGTYSACRLEPVNPPPMLWRT